MAVGRDSRVQVLLRVEGGPTERVVRRTLCKERIVKVGSRRMERRKAVHHLKSKGGEEGTVWARLRFKILNYQ